MERQKQSKLEKVCKHLCRNKEDYLLGTFVVTYTMAFGCLGYFGIENEAEKISNMIESATIGAMSSSALIGMAYCSLGLE